jgi:AraC-like DNA-binding protein
MQVFNERPASRLSFSVLTLGRAPREPGFDIGWRRLPATLIESPNGGCWELSLEGRAEPMLVQSGQIAVVPKEVAHRLRVPGKRAFTTTYLLGHFHWLSSLDLIAPAGIPNILPVAAGARLVPLIRQMVRQDASAGRSIASAARIQELGFQVLHALMTYATQPDFQVPTALTRLEPSLRRMNEKPSAVSCVELARLVHLSPTRFHAVFKQAVGVAPKVYLRNQRLRRACELLVQSDLPVYAVADQCGFESSFYFCRVFRSYIGQTPMHFRMAFGKPL